MHAPQMAWIEVDGTTHRVYAHALAGDELKSAWRRIELDAPAYATYRTMTDRPIPIVRLLPVVQAR